jgi:hypothetical protein
MYSGKRANILGEVKKKKPTTQEETELLLYPAQYTMI